MHVKSYDNIPVTCLRKPLAGRMLIAVAREVGQPGEWVAYRPALWFGETATVRRRKRWSRTALFLEDTGLLTRHVDLGRNRVRQVTVTTSGWQWVLDNCGPGAVLSLDKM